MRTMDRRAWQRLILACCVITSMIACTEKKKKKPDEIKQAALDTTAKTSPQVAKEAGATTTTLAPRVPFEGDDFKPALSRVEGTFDPKTFMEVDACKECHAEIVSEWSDSMHSFASLSNNIYFNSFDGFLKERGEENTRFCAGCHDPALMFDPASKIAADTSSPNAHLGIGCDSCHGVIATTPAGNGSYTLTTTPIPIPVDGDDASLKAHLARVGDPALRAQTLCVSCHRGTLTPEMGHDVVLPGLDELGPWRDSAFNGNQTVRIDDAKIPQETCVSCHMPEVDGYKSHRFPGGHSTFAAMIDSKEQLAAIREQVEGAASLDIFPLKTLPPSTRSRGEGALGFDVVIFNERVAHNFPGGAKDLRDTWVEVVVKDAEGKILGSSGVEHARTGEEDYTYVLHARLASEDGDTQREHDVSHFRAPVYDHTIAPRDAAVVRYALDVPEGASRPIKVEARLRHRRFTSKIYASACLKSKTPEGKARAADTKKYKGVAPDPCIPQPILDIATASSEITVAQREDSWRRHYVYGLGLLHHVQENVGEARVAFERAREMLGEGGAARHRAMVIQGLAKVSSRQGRTEEAVALFEEAGALVGEHPSTYYGIGETYMRVWRFPEAIEAFEKAAALQPDARVYQRLAIALGSAQRPAEALEIAQKGLALESRNPHLLRSQMLAYRGLEGVDEWREQATAAFNVYKRDTKAPHVRDKCSASDEVCRAERTPIGIRWLSSK